MSEDNVLPVLPGTHIRIEAVGEMFEDGDGGRYTESLLPGSSPMIFIWTGQKNGGGGQPSPASPAPSPPPVPRRRRQVLLRAPPEGEDSCPGRSISPPALRSRAPLPPGPQGASPYLQCSTPPDWSYSVEVIILAKCDW